MFSYFLYILKKNKITVFFLSLVTFIFLRILPQYAILKNFLSLPGIPLHRDLEIIWEYGFKSLSHVPFIEQIVAVLFPLLLSLNIVIFIIYVKYQQKYFSKRGAALSLSGIILGFFGVGCLSCGALVLAPLISLVGLGSLLKYGEELSLIGLVLIIASIVFLLRKLTQPLVC